MPIETYGIYIDKIMDKMRKWRERYLCVW